MTGPKGCITVWDGDYLVFQSAKAVPGDDITEQWKSALEAARAYGQCLVVVDLPTGDFYLRTKPRPEGDKP